MGVAAAMFLFSYIVLLVVFIVNRSRVIETRPQMVQRTFCNEHRDGPTKGKRMFAWGGNKKKLTAGQRSSSQGYAHTTAPA